jgi:hypothetical protein
VEDDREDRLERRVREEYRRTPAASADFRARILRGLDDHDAAARRVTMGTWWWRPCPLRLAPAGILAAACLLVAAGAWLGGGLPRVRQAATRESNATRNPQGANLASVPGIGSSGSPGRGAARAVAFMLVAPGVNRVALVGEFNDWDPLATPLVRVGRDGPWVATVALPPGRHVYGFMIDGSRWMPDPHAPLAPDDGFGSTNSVVLVGQDGSL